MTANPTEPFSLGPNADRLLSWREVRSRTGLSRTTAWRLQNSGAFPRPVALSPGRVGWRETEIAAWTATLAPRTRPPPARPRPVQPIDHQAAPPAPAARSVSPEPREPIAAASQPAGRRRASVAPGQLSFDF